MNIKFYNPRNLKIPTQLQLLVDDKYIVSYERDYNVTSQHHVAYTFSIRFNKQVLKIDTIQQIMMEIGKALTEQSYDDGIELDIHDFEIQKIDNHMCVYKLIFFKS